jgi:hypothetical protein
MVALHVRISRCRLLEVEFLMSSLCRHIPELWGGEGSRKGVEAGQQKEQEEGKEKGEKKEGTKGEKEGSEMARRPEHEGDVIFRDFFTPFFAGRCV